MSDKIIENKAHAFSSNSRNGIDVSGVLDVVNFDEGGVVMETSCGSMAVEGEGLHVTVLNVADGKVSIEARSTGSIILIILPRSREAFSVIRNDRSFTTGFARTADKIVFSRSGSRRVLRSYQGV